jgi:hypothetical protein
MRVHYIPLAAFILPCAGEFVKKGIALNSLVQSVLAHARESAGMGYVAILRSRSLVNAL